MEGAEDKSSASPTSRPTPFFPPTTPGHRPEPISPVHSERSAEGESARPVSPWSSVLHHRRRGWLPAKYTAAAQPDGDAAMPLPPMWAHGGDQFPRHGRKASAFVGQDSKCWHMARF